MELSTIVVGVMGGLGMFLLGMSLMTEGLKATAGDAIRTSLRRVKWSDDTDLLEILRGGGVFLIIRLLGSAAAYFFAWYISIEYGPEGNGVLSFTLTSAVLLSAIFNLGLNTYAVRIIPQFIHEKNEGNVRKFYQTALRMIIRTMIAGSLILFLLSYIPSSKDLARDIRLFTLLALPLSILLFTSHVFRARKNILIFSLLQNNTDRKSTRLNSSHVAISYAVFCLKKKK